LLRPIQYTGALLEACVVSSGALVLGTPAVADPVTVWGVLAAVFVDGWGVATQEDSTRAPGSTNRSTAERFRLPPAACRRRGFLLSMVIPVPALSYKRCR
jgi:hypothetical protein